MFDKNVQPIKVKEIRSSNPVRVYRNMSSFFHSNPPIVNNLPIAISYCDRIYKPLDENNAYFEKYVLLDEKLGELRVVKYNCRDENHHPDVRDYIIRVDIGERIKYFHSDSLIVHKQSAEQSAEQYDEPRPLPKRIISISLPICNNGFKLLPGRFTINIEGKPKRLPMYVSYRAPTDSYQFYEYNEWINCNTSNPRHDILKKRLLECSDESSPRPSSPSLNGGTKKRRPHKRSSLKRRKRSRRQRRRRIL